MNIIQYNPYRLLGLLVGSSAQQLNRHRTRIPNYISAGNEIPTEFTEFSFDVLGKIERTEENIANAASKLGLDSDKMSAALFWFYNGNPITDEPAFDALKEGNIEQAINIWSKLTASGELNQRNASSYSNLSTLFLSKLGNDKIENEAFLDKGVSLKLKFLESEFSRDLKIKATDETYKINRKQIQLLFLNQLQVDLNKCGTSNNETFLNIVIKNEFAAKDDIINETVQKHIDSIEKKIENSKNKRKENQFNALSFGQKLFDDSQNELKLISDLLDKDSSKYSLISDKLANEILQCAIDYYNENKEIDTENDYIENAIKLAEQAKFIAIGKIVKDRIKDNIDTLKELKDKEINDAIELLQSIKDAYLKNEVEISEKVSSMKLGHNQTIDWNKVNNMIKMSIDWDKVVDLILKVIPEKNMSKIKATKEKGVRRGKSRIQIYNELAGFVLNNLNYTQKNKVKYISFQIEEYGQISMKFKTKKTPIWLKWLVGIIVFLLVIYIVWGEEGLENLFTVLGGIFIFVIASVLRGGIKFNK